MDNITPKEIADEEMINQAFQELLNDYLHTKHRKRVEIITKAFNFANQAHKGIKRRSGEPYIMHPIAVAQIVCNEIGLGSTSICAALLHDVVEDTDYTVEDIENIFGPKIAQIVDGLTKISGGIFGDRASAQAENFKKLLLTMSNDIRVILIKIADRLHNMRTLGSMLPNKQYKIAGETLYIYAPLANRLGLYKIKTELENLSFKYEHPEEYAEIEEKLNATAAERDKVFNDFTAPIRTQLDKMGLKYRILARVKSIYSIWNKMQTKHVPFEEIYDLLAVRIIFEPRNVEEELNDCFDIYVSISKIYKPHPDRLRDWVSHPKANGYQALHVTLMGNNGQWIEVQIRSERMNDVAEQGFAAHWKYKEGGGSEDEGELEKWLKTIKEILDDPQPDAIDFLDTIKLNLFASEIFVFTPKGDVIALPQGSTIIDFAYAIHSEVGNKMIGAKINGMIVPIDKIPQNGEIVEILTSSASHGPSRDWLKIVKTSEARNKIRQWFKREKRAENIEVGRAEIEREFLRYPRKATEDQKNEIVSAVARRVGMQETDDLFNAIGYGGLAVAKIASKLRDEFDRVVKVEEVVQPQPEQIVTKPSKRYSTGGIIVDGQAGCEVKFAKCCNPLPGDSVIGYITKGYGISIHKRDCPNVIAGMKSNEFFNRWVHAEWDKAEIKSSSGKLFEAVVQIYAENSMSLIADISSALASMRVAITQLNTKICSDSDVLINISVGCKDTEHYNSIVSRLKSIPGVTSVVRGFNG